MRKVNMWRSLVTAVLLGTENLTITTIDALKVNVIKSVFTNLKQQKLLSNTLINAAALNKQEPTSKTFQLQFVGSNSEGVDPNSKGECLQADDEVQGVDGIALEFVECKDGEVGQVREICRKCKDGEVGQQWSFSTSGRIESKKHTNKCVQRYSCSGTPVYNLDSCDRNDSAVFEAGRPIHALQSQPDCLICGPYRLTQFCKDGKVHNSSVCLKKSASGNGNTFDSDSLHGWTRGRSQFIFPPDKDPGRNLWYELFGIGKDTSIKSGSGGGSYQYTSSSGDDSDDGLISPSSFASDAESVDSDNTGDSGFGPLSEKVCGTKAGDTASAGSFYYLKKV